MLRNAKIPLQVLAGEFFLLCCLRAALTYVKIKAMGWDADATKDGKRMTKDWKVKTGSNIIDPTLRAAFGQSNRKLKQLTGYGNIYLMEGMIHGNSCSEILKLATGEPSFRNYIVWGQIEWTEELVQRLSLTANWNIPKHSGHPEEYSWLPEAYEEDDYWWVKMFWDVCVEHHLGLFLSW